MPVPMFLALEQWAHQHMRLQDSYNRQRISAREKLTIFYGLPGMVLQIKMPRSDFSTQVKLFQDQKSFNYYFNIFINLLCAL